MAPTLDHHPALRALLAVVALWGCGPPAPAQPAEPPSGGTAAAAEVADGGPGPSALLDPAHPHWRRRAPERFRVRVETSRGPFVIEVERAWAPRGADRFYALATAGYYDDSRFYRVRQGFIAQFGIAGEPAVASLWRRETIADDPVRAENARGTLAFAMTGPGTRSTQIYINTGDNRRLDAEGFAPIGRVVSGIDVVDRLYAGYDEGSGGGMRGGRQDPLFAGGNAYADAAYPKLDRLIRAVVVDRDPP